MKNAANTDEHHVTISNGGSNELVIAKHFPLTLKITNWEPDIYG